MIDASARLASRSPSCARSGPARRSRSTTTPGRRSTPSAGERSAGSSASGRTVYGVNTGFGLLAQTRIPDDRLAELQRNLILSHSCGLGEALDPPVVRLVMVLKAIGLGARP